MQFGWIVGIVDREHAGGGSGGLCEGKCAIENGDGQTATAEGKGEGESDDAGAGDAHVWTHVWARHALLDACGSFDGTGGCCGLRETAVGI